MKTGTRWQMSSSLRKHLKQLPFFLLFNYPKKINAYENVKAKNKQIEDPQEKLALNAYHSPSPMNELCEYICTWENKKIIWDKAVADTRPLIINQDLALTDKRVIRIVRHYINSYAAELKKHINLHMEHSDHGQDSFCMEEIVTLFQTNLDRELKLDPELTANYVISVSYRNPSISKSFAWAGYGDYIIKNLKKNTSAQKKFSITEVDANTNDVYEYLGKYYKFEEGDKN